MTDKRDFEEDCSALQTSAASKLLQWRNVMSYYQPDCWVVLKLPECYKVLAGWSGGYLDGSAWRLNSGITRVEKNVDWKDEEYFVFYGHTGSEYWCHPETYMLKMPMAGIYNHLKEEHQDHALLMPEDTDWMNMEWKI
jgi:hypothetical protein